MKKNILFICCCLMWASSLFAQEVPEVQKTLVTKVTATWCPNCGSWGWDYFEYAIEDNSDKAIFVGAHHSGGLESAAGSDFSSNFQAPYQPYFYAGNADMDVTNGNTTAKRTELQEIINANAEMAPVANIGFAANLTGEFLTIEAKAKFFQEATGDYYMAVYILEDGIVHNQSSNSTMAVHPFVMRTSLTDSSFGSSMMNGTIAADTEFDESFSLQLNPNWNKENLVLIGVVWEKVEDTYQFVNVNSTTDFDATITSTNIITEDILKVNLFPTVASESATLNVNLNTDAFQANIQLFNQQGQVVRSLYQGMLNEGTRSFNINTNDLNAGVYFVSIRAEDGAVVTKKLLVQ